MEIKVVTILGANGAMGSNIAGIFASFGMAKVYLVCRNVEKAKAAVERAAMSVKSDSIRERLVPVDYSELAKCVAESDMVYESVAEDMEIKSKIWQEVSNYIGENTLCCTGTSGLSVTRLASILSEDKRDKFFGMHFFNPPYNLSLCEMISTEYSNQAIFEKLKEYASSKLLRQVVEVSDTPGFLGNRIGFQFMNRALQYAEKYKEEGGIDYIDYILGPVTGRSMPPILTVDFVGLDIHKSIVDYLHDQTKDFSNQLFVLPEYVSELIDNGKLGRKSKEGLYRKRVVDGESVSEVYDIKTKLYRKREKYDMPFVTKMRKLIAESEYAEAYQVLLSSDEKEAKICRDFMLNYVLYSLSLNRSVGKDFYAAENVMVTGFNWCSPLGIVELLGGKDKCSELIKAYLNEYKITEISIEDIREDMVESNYDYRKFIKA